MAAQSPHQIMNEWTHDPRELLDTYAAARELGTVLPAVTCSVQSTFLTGALPRDHGIVGNGWLFRDTGEVRFWQQSNRLLQAEPLYVTAWRRAAQRGQAFRCAKLFWWFNQGAAVDFSVTPKPYYAADGNKAFGIHGTPPGLTEYLERTLGPFPFHTFWGPKAGLPCTRWIAACAAAVLRAFAGGRGGLRLSDVARRSGLGMSTASRLLTTLETLDLVERDPVSGLYRLGFGVVGLWTGLSIGLIFVASGLIGVWWRRIHALPGVISTELFARSIERA